MRSSDLVCKYGAATALKGVTLRRVGEGEIVALVGANGAGKTTLLRTLSGLMRPAGGQHHASAGSASTGAGLTRSSSSAWPTSPRAAW